VRVCNEKGILLSLSISLVSTQGDLLTTKFADLICSGQPTAIITIVQASYTRGCKAKEVTTIPPPGCQLMLKSQYILLLCSFPWFEHITSLLPTLIYPFHVPFIRAIHFTVSFRLACGCLTMPSSEHMPFTQPILSSQNTCLSGFIH
jgi:hypothetical protein